MVPTIFSRHRPSGDALLLSRAVCSQPIHLACVPFALYAYSARLRRKKLSPNLRPHSAQRFIGSGSCGMTTLVGVKRGVSVERNHIFLVIALVVGRRVVGLVVLGRRRRGRRRLRRGFTKRLFGVALGERRE